MYDLVIIGSGPAGLCAALYACRAMMNFVLIEKQSFSGGQIINTNEVDNYLGLPNENGFDLAMKFRQHAENAGTEFIQKEVLSIEKKDNIFTLTLNNNENIITKSVLIATGAVNKKLDIPGEKEFTGKGVSYCANCDGAFFRDKVTAVVGGGDTALEDALYLSKICKKVYLIHRRNKLRGAESMQNLVLNTENITVIWDTVVNSINGKEKVESLSLENTKTNEEHDLTVDGVFIAVGTQPVSSLVKDLVLLDDMGYIIADETGKTNIDGIFCGGDVRQKNLRQVITAVSDGANCIYSVQKHLNNL